MFVIERKHLAVFAQCLSHRLMIGMGQVAGQVIRRIKRDQDGVGSAVGAIRYVTTR
jgi:hypothetical protein